MAWKHIPGIGLTNTPDPINKSYAQSERMTEAERASQLPDDQQNQRYVDDGVRKYLVSDIEAEVQEAAELIKHELISSHAHDELAASDVEPAEQFDENGNSTVAELSADDAEYREELDENGNPIADELDEVDLVMGTEDKSKLLAIGDEVFVPSMNIKGLVEAFNNETVTIRHDGRLKSFALEEAMPA